MSRLWRWPPSYRTAYASLGIPLFRAKNDDASQVAFCSALLLDPADAYPHLGLGWIAARRKRWAEAETEFGAALALQPDLIDAHQGLAEALEAQGRSQEAIEPYQEFLKLALRGRRPLNEMIATDPAAGPMLDSDQARVHVSLARIYDGTGDTKRPVAEYLIGIAGGHDSVRIRLRVARLYVSQQQWRDARQHAFAGLLLIPAAVRRRLYRILRAFGTVNRSFRR